MALKLEKQVGQNMAPKNSNTKTRVASHILKKCVNLVMRHGKKEKAEKIVFAMLQGLHHRFGQPGLQVLIQALHHISPLVKIQTVRVRRRSYQVPFPLAYSKQLGVGLKWVVSSARKTAPRTFATQLQTLVELAYQKKGDLVKKKLDLHKTAKTNRPFAHYRWS